MAAYTLPHFGNLQIDNLEEYYDFEMEFNGNKITVDLNFDTKTIDVLTMDKIKNVIENIDTFDKVNKTYIQDDYNDEEGDTVKFYLEHHLEEFSKEELATLINFDDTTTDLKQQLLTKLKLIRVGLYVESEANSAIFDYSFGYEITNYLVVINTDINGELDYLSMES